MEKHVADIAFVVPCYNEAENVVATLENIVLAARARSVNYEIVVIDDCSTDETRSVVLNFKNLNPDVPLIFSRNEVNRGLGFNHRRGASLSSARYYSFIPGDNDYPASAIAEILERLGQADMLLPYARYEDFKERPFFRRVLSRVHTYIVRAISGYNIHYFNSPAIYPRVFVAESKQNADGFGYFSELLSEALDRGFSYMEFPVPANYLNEKETSAFRLKNISSVLASLCRILGRRWQKIFLKARRIIFQNLGVIVVALILGGIYFLPNILISAIQDQNGFGVYHPLSLEAPTLDEVAAYGSRLREVMDGHFVDGDAYLAEYKNRPTLWGSDVMAVALGVIPFILGMKNPTLIYVFGDLFFPVIIFLAAYALFFFITRNKLWSIFGALIFCAFPNISVFRSFLSPSFYENFSLFGVFAIFNRAFDGTLSRLFVPGFSLIFFIIFLLATLRALSGKKEKNYFSLMPAILAFGALFYVYFYYWAFATVLMLILLALFLFFNKEKAFTALKILLGGLIVSLPYWFKVLSLRANPLYKELSARVGLEYSRNFVMSSLDAYILAIFLFLFLLWLGKKRGEIITSIFLGAALLSYVVVLNMQMVTGFNIQPDHWGSRVNIYILSLGVMVALFWSFDFLSGKIKKLISSSIIVAVIVFFMCVAIISQIRMATIGANDYRIHTDLLQAFKWINNHTPKDSVFFSPSSKTTFYIPFFTHGNVYVPPACYSLASEEEIIDRFLEAYAAFGVKEEFLKKSLEANLGDGRDIEYARGMENDPIYMLFCDSFADLKPGGYISGNSLRPFPREILTDLLNRYHAKLLAQNRDKLTLSRRADYIFWGPNERLISSVSPKEYKNLRLIFSENLVQIYEFIH